MGLWDIATPAGSDPISQGDDRIREMKVALQEALQCGGIFPGPNPTTAPEFYPVIAKGAEASRPAASADYAGRMYANETNKGIDRIKDDGSAWEQIYKDPASYAVHQAAAAALASVAGVVTLPETGNSFNVTGTEAVTSIAGWSAGIVIIRWTSARILTHGASLVIQGALSRNVCAGDISIFEFAASNAVREIGFHGALSGMEAGTVFMHAGTSAPAGALECDGSSDLRADYPRLYGIVGTSFGTADGTHFNRPDLRGRVPRGYDHAAGRDPDAATRTANAAGGATGDNVGSVQEDEFKSHTHPLTTSSVYSQSPNDTNVHNYTTDSGWATGPTGGNETRPKNISLMFCIKY